MTSATATSSSSSGSSSGSSIRTSIQKAGTFLSKMIMPNIAAFIAWGIITALFIPVGFLPNEQLVTMVGPMVHYMLPILIAFTGGNMIYGHRGGVVGVIGLLGAILGSDTIVVIPDDAGQIHMFIGAMLLGPLGAWLMKKADGLWAHRVKPGFEMLVNNFSAGILGTILAIAAFYIVGPGVEWITQQAATVIDFLVENSLLPLTSVLIEPAKVAFLNNAINHGVLTPLGTQEATNTGQSILFLLETNPGPGLGVLLAYMVAGKGDAKASAPGASIIHFFGGIHEIYFPYVLAKPILILSVIAGGMTGVFTNMIFDNGLLSPAAPGSILAIMGVSAPGKRITILIAVFAAAAVSFVVSVFLMRLTGDGEADLSAATASMESMKGKKSSVAGMLTGTGAITEVDKIDNIVFACDAGMGSSAMGASTLRRKIHGAGYEDVSVTNKAIADLDDEWDLVVTHQDLTQRAQERTGSAVHVSVDNFMSSPKYDEIVEMIRQNREGNGQSGGESAGGGASSGGGGGTATATAQRTETEQQTDVDADDEVADVGGAVLTTDAIVLGGSASDRDGAIDEAGRLLVQAGAVEQGYVDAMHERETSVSTAMGNGLAIPHGTNEAKGMVERSGMSVIKYPDGIDWNGKPVTWVVGIAGKGNEHLDLLSSIAGIFTDDDQIAELDAAQSEQEVLDIFDRNVG